MLKMQFYRCEYCEDTFEFEEECRQCEASHVATDDIKRENCFYKFNQPYPHKIKLNFADGKVIEYVTTVQIPVVPAPSINQVPPNQNFYQPNGQAPNGPIPNQVTAQPNPNVQTYGYNTVQQNDIVSSLPPSTQSFS